MQSRIALALVVLFAASAAHAASKLVANPRNNARVTVQKGTDLVVRLNGNPTAGYRWKVIATDRSFGYPTEKYVQTAPRGMVGGGGYFQFTWKTTTPFAAGVHRVTFGYQRSWEKKPLRKTTIVVTVR